MAKNSLKVPKRIGSFKLKKRHRKMLGSALVVLEAAEALGIIGTAGGLLQAKSKKGKKGKQDDLAERMHAGA